MRTNDKARDNMNETEILKESDSTPKRSLRAARELCYLRLLGIYGFIVGPQSKQSEGHFTLSYRKAKLMLEVLSDKVILLNKQGRRENPVRG